MMLCLSPSLLDFQFFGKIEKGTSYTKYKETSSPYYTMNKIFAYKPEIPLCTKKNLTVNTSILYFVFENASLISDITLENGTVSCLYDMRRKLRIDLNLTDNSYDIENLYDDEDYDDDFKLYNEIINESTLYDVLVKVDAVIDKIEDKIIDKGKDKVEDKYEYEADTGDVSQYVDMYNNFNNTLPEMKWRSAGNCSSQQYRNPILQHIIGTQSKITVDLLSDASDTALTPTSMDGNLSDIDDDENTPDTDIIVYPKNSSNVDLLDMIEEESVCEDEVNGSRDIFQKQTNTDIINKINEYFTDSGDEDEVELESNNYEFDEDEVRKVSEKYINEQPDADPQHVMFNDRNHIVKILIALVKKINEKSDKVRIYVKDNNIFTVTVKLINITGEQLLGTYKQYKETNEDFDGSLYYSIDIPNITYGRYPIIPDFNLTIFDDSFVYGVKKMDFFKLVNWNPTNNLLKVTESLWDIINEKGMLKLGSNNNIVNSIINVEHYLGIVKESQVFNIDFIKIFGSNSTSKVTSNLSAGTGYSVRNSDTWNQKEHASEIREKNKAINTNMLDIEKMLENTEFNFDEYYVRFIDLIIYYYTDISYAELTEHYLQFRVIAKAIKKIITHEKFDSSFEAVIKCINTTNKNFILFKKTIKDDDKDFDSIQELFVEMESIVEQLVIDTPTKQKTSVDHKEAYVEAMADKQFECVEKLSSFHFKDFEEVLKPRNVMKEYMSLAKDLPLSYDTSIFVAYEESAINKLKFMIIGPKDTPYQDGCYTFDLLLPANYPSTHPQCHFLTTGHGRVRFNPNLYNAGKVCLSLLGTWSGEAWTANSTILQLLISIQSLILIEEPYFNEPGYTREYGTATGTERSNSYNKNIRTQNINWGIIDVLKNPIPEFADIIKIHFKSKKDDIIKMAKEWNYTQMKQLQDTLDKV
jgi:ubiquitin-protein ligase